MLESVTQTALLRRWPPTLYARLCSQLQDSGQSQGAVEYLVSAIQSPPIPLLYEYILVLCTDPKSLLPLEHLLDLWSQERLETRSPQTKQFMAYVAKGLAALEPFQKPKTASQAVVSLARQGAKGSVESEFLVFALGKSAAGTQLQRQVPSLSDDLVAVDPKYAHVFGPSEKKEKSFYYKPGRSFRLLWLNEFISSCILYPGDQLMQEQLDILWPNEKPNTLIYEFGLTSFDAFASAIELKNRVSIWNAFITKKLPLVLKFIAGSQPLDAALTRLLTTMDKEVATIVDSLNARIIFMRACIDLGLCDSSVLHVLHRSYTPKPEVLDSVAGISVATVKVMGQQAPSNYENATVVQLIKELTNLRPLTQELASQELHKFVRNPKTTLKLLSWFCTAFLVSPESCDNFFMHVPSKYLIDHLVKRLESAKTAMCPPGSPTARVEYYGEVATVFIFIRFLLNRYDIIISQSEQQSFWAFAMIFQEPTLYSNYEEMDQPLQSLLGAWITAISAGKGLNDECFKPANLVFDIFPVLTKQLVLGVETGAVSIDTLRSGFENLPVALLPNFMRILLYHLWAQINVGSTSKILQLVLGLLLARNTPQHKMATNFVGPMLMHFKGLAIELKMGDIDKLISRAEPIEFSRLECKGSFVSMIRTTLKNLVQWQLEPVGVPLIDSRLFEMGVRYFKKEKIMQLVADYFVDVDQGTAIELQVAIVVIYCSRLVTPLNSIHLIPTGIFAPNITEIATSYVERFQAIYENHLVVTEDELPEEEAPDASIFNVPEMPVYEPDTSFTNGFDMDEPMDLAELDDAMNVDFFG